MMTLPLLALPVVGVGHDGVAENEAVAASEWLPLANSLPFSRLLPELIINLAIALASLQFIS